MQVPPLTWAMSLRVKIGPEQQLGACAEGLRGNYPILGGEFFAESLQGRVLPGGADLYLERGDGVGVLSARYTLLAEDGTLINVLNDGYLVMTPAGRAAAMAGTWPLPESDYQCRCSPRFQVGLGEHADWGTRVFIGTVTYPSVDEVHIEVFHIAA